MCNLYSITTNQAAIIALFRVINQIRQQPAPDASGVFPDYIRHQSCATPTPDAN